MIFLQTLRRAAFERASITTFSYWNNPGIDGLTSVLAALAAFSAAAAGA